MQKRINFFDNSGFKEFNLGKRKLHLNNKVNSALAKHLFIYLFFYDLIIVNDSLSDTLEKAKSGASSILQTARKDGLNKQIFAHLNFNSVRNKFDFLADIIKLSP